MDDNEMSFMEWYWGCATPEERQLADLVGGFEDLFEDMLFRPDTGAYDLTVVTYITNGEEIEAGWGIPDELEYFMFVEKVRFKIDELDGINGYYNHSNKCLCIDKSRFEAGEEERDSTILHEMTHVFCDLIDSCPKQFHDLLFWALYKDLKTKIDDLDNYITDHAKELGHEGMFEQTSDHDILFLLKSLDLDLRQGYKLGTVFGYGKTGDIEYIDDHKDE